MEPRHLSSFLGKYSKLPTPEKYIRAVLEEFLGVPGCIRGVSARAGILFVKATPSVKQEIHLKHKKLLQFLREKKLHVVITEVR